MGIGIGSGEERIVEAARSHLFTTSETTIDGAEDVIVNVTGGLDMTLTEAEIASEIATQLVMVLTFGLVHQSMIH